MPTFKFDKLIRDKILNLHLESSHDVTFTKLKGIELKKQLIRKLHEEVDEVPVGELATAEVIEEIGDVQQVLDDLKAQYGLSDETIRDVQRHKREKKGGFSNGVYIDKISLGEDDEWTQYYRSSPDKYPEIYPDTHDVSATPHIEAGIYRHYKGKNYEVLGVGCHSETDEYLVVYKPLYEHGGQPDLWARPYNIFVEDVSVSGEAIPRFRKVK